MLVMIYVSSDIVGYDKRRPGGGSPMHHSIGAFDMITTTHMHRGIER